jgi:hypothetical protein
MKRLISGLAVTIILFFCATRPVSAQVGADALLLREVTVHAPDVSFWCRTDSSLLRMFPFSGMIETSVEGRARLWQVKCWVNQLPPRLAVRMEGYVNGTMLIHDYRNRRWMVASDADHGNRRYSVKPGQFIAVVARDHGTYRLEAYEESAEVSSAESSAVTVLATIHGGRVRVGGLELGFPGAIAQTVELTGVQISELAAHPVEALLKRSSLVGPIYDIHLVQTRSTFDSDVMVTIRYPDADQDGVIDGTAWREDSLVMMSYSSVEGSWQTLPTMVDAGGNTATGLARHFSLFRLVIPTAGAAQGNLARFSVYPNPYKPNDGDANNGKPFSSSDATSGIIFNNLTNSVVIEVFSMAGERVFKYESNATGGAVQWDTRNRNGREVTSGYYFYIVRDPATGERVAGKLAIAR